MKLDNELINEFRSDLKELTGLNALSVSMQPMITRLRNLYTPLTDKIVVDQFGNLAATREGKEGMPHIVVIAHAEEVGAIVASIEPDGFIRFFPIGEVKEQWLVGRAVLVKGQLGIISTNPGYLTSESKSREITSENSLFIDLGLDSSADVEALGVRIGDPVVVLSQQLDLANSRVAGKSIGSHAGCIMLLHLLRRLHQHSLNCHLTVLVTVQEGIGQLSAALTRLQPDLIIVIGTFNAAGTPDTHNSANACRIGNGAVITPAFSSGSIGFFMPLAFREAMIKAAQRANVPYQLAVEDPKFTNPTIAPGATNQIPSMEVNIPCRYLHSPVEMLDLGDLVAVLSLVENLVLDPPAYVEEHVTYHTMPKDLSVGDNIAKEIRTTVESIQQEEG
jgi:putative aminopeptidase